MSITKKKVSIVIVSVLTLITLMTVLVFADTKPEVQEEKTIQKKERVIETIEDNKEETAEESKSEEVKTEVIIEPAILPTPEPTAIPTAEATLTETPAAEAAVAGIPEVSNIAATGTGMSITQSEMDLLAAIIQCEAGGECREGKVAVGAVVLNRVRSASFPDNIYDVIYQKRQFSPVTNGSLSRTLANGARSDCYEAAQAALNGENPVGDCLFFNSGRGKGIQIGNQHFY